MRRRGYTLALTVVYLTLVSMLSLAAASMLSQVRQQVALAKHRTGAQCMAESGVEYARSMLASHRWAEAHDYRSPDFRGGRFHLVLRRAGGGWHVRSEGMSGTAVKVVERDLP